MNKFVAESCNIARKRASPLERGEKAVTKATIRDHACDRQNRVHKGGEKLSREGPRHSSSSPTSP